MGKKGSWFSSIKKTLSPSSKENKIQKSERNEENPSVPVPPIVENAGGSYDSHRFPPPEDVNPIEVEAEPPITAASTAAASATTRYSGKSRDEEAAIRIQTAFRGYSARRSLWALRGLVRLKTVVEGPGVNRQTANTLKYTQNASQLQSQINSRRNRMSENQALQRQLLRAKELAKLQNGDDWNDSVQSKEEMEAKLLSKYEATMRRERAMAYSFSHQQPWKKSAATTNMLFMDPTNPQWGWSWSERYMAGRPAAAEAQDGKDPGNNVKSGVSITGTEIAKSYARHQLNSAPSTPRSKSGGPVASRKPKPGPSPSPRAPVTEGGEDDDSKSVVSVRSERNRRHSVGNLGGSPAAGKRMVSKGKSRVQGLSENGGGAKKELSFPGSPAKPRRHSGPPKVETAVE